MIISVRLTLGTKVKEGVVRKMMNDLTELTAARRIFIIGGDTKISEAMQDFCAKLAPSDWP